MRYREFELTEDELFELKMSPSNLARMAKDIDARAGLEFELVIPDFEGEEQEYDPEPDYDADERFPTGTGWRRDVVSFFRGGDSPNSSGYIERQISNLEENFYGWLDDESENFINSDEGQERALEIAADNVSEDDYETTEQYEAALRGYIDRNEDQIRDRLLDEYREDMDSHWERYLDEEGINSMADFANEYNLDWPYWMYPERDGGNFSVDSVAQDFSDAIGRPVTVSGSYHGATRRAGHYAVEPDSSIEGDDGEGGLEFVSPPLPIPEMLADIDKVVKWASRIGAYTNESTGLHMNVSVPQQDQLDFVKLVMFLGDNYILEQFGREGNHYCQSMLDKIKSTARSNPDRVDEMLRQFQGGLNQLASKMVHTGSTSKYSSINVQSNRVEFRSPGGDWMGEYASDPGKVKNTLLRGVVALGVATDPTAYKQEYYKKLYKTLSQGREDNSIEYFAKYAAGELPKQALKSFIKQLQTKRQVGKDAGSGKLYWWRVFRQGYSGSIEVVAATREEAIDKGTASDGYPSWRGQPDVRAEPVRPYTAEQTPSRDQEFTGTWEVVSRNSNEVVHTIRGIGNAVADAERHAATWQEQTGFDDPVYVRPQMRPRQQQTQAGGEQSTDANYEIVDRRTMRPVFRFIANTDQEAARKYTDWLAGQGIEDTTEDYGWRRIAGRSAAEPVPGSTEYLNRELAAQEPAGGVGQQTYRVTYTTMDDQGTSMHDTSVRARNADAAMAQVRQALQARGQTPEYISADPLISTSTPAQGTESLPPGNVRWRVLDSNDREVHSFVHRAEQREANAYAVQWLRQNGMLGQGEFMVVPVQ